MLVTSVIALAKLKYKYVAHI